jgi:hypothetical protein
LVKFDKTFQPTIQLTIQNGFLSLLQTINLMGRVVYFLKKPTLSNKLISKAEKEKALKNIPHLIVLQYRYSGNKVTFTFNQKVAPSNWDGKRQRVKYNKQTTEDNKFNVNEILDTLPENVKELIMRK